jgi:hypothetical protein
MYFAHFLLFLVLALGLTFFLAATFALGLDFVLALGAVFVLASIRFSNAFLRSASVALLTVSF